MILIVLGGIGFLTVEELRRLWRDGWTGWTRHLSLHSRLALTVTAMLLVSGAAFYLFLEWNNTLAGFALPHRIVNSMFMSVTARTAGFNTVDYGTTADSTNFLTILLMSVGGSPGSTAGGLKTTTIAVIVLLAWARLQGSQVSSAWGRSVPEETVHRAVGLFVVMFGTMTMGLFLFMVLEGRLTVGEGVHGGFLGHMFEVASAFNTVGLSMGETAGLHGGAKGVTILLMFLGRVGPLSAAAALAREEKHEKTGFRYSYDGVMIG
jgi:trk system potassium uptake protein TrkH